MVYGLPRGKPFYNQHDNRYTISDNNYSNCLKKKPPEQYAMWFADFVFRKKKIRKQLQLASTYTHDYTPNMWHARLVR